MKVVEVRAIAAQRGIQAGRKNKEELIRTIQKTEGNDACFNIGKADACGQTECLWRDDCD